MCLEDSGELLGAGGLEPRVSSRKVVALPGQGLFTPEFGAGLACVASVPWLFLLGGGEHTRARGEDLTPPSCEVLGLRHGHQLS